MDAEDPEKSAGKIKSFRTSSRLKLPPRELKPDDDSVYDRFLGNIERSMDMASHQLQAGVPAPPVGQIWRDDDGGGRVDDEQQAHQIPKHLPEPSPSPFRPTAVVEKFAPVKPVVKPAAVRPEANLTGPAADHHQPDFDVNAHMRKVTRLYRLNRGEDSVLGSLLSVSHAVGKDVCEVTVPKIMASSTLSEQRVRRNLKSLREKGWILLIKEFDPQKHTPAIYRIFLSPNPSKE